MVRKRLGIITGSGPDAGVQLWEAILRRARAQCGEHYRGDIDSPYVAILSDPVLGHSMDLDSYNDLVIQHLKDALLSIDKQADVYAIACVTLHALLPKIETLPRKGTLVSAIDSMVSYAKKNSLKTIAVISAETVSREKNVLLRRLSEFVELEVPRDPTGVHTLVMDIKRLGGSDQGVISRFRALVDSLTSRTVMLACTDLPLVQIGFDDRDIVNCTDLVAEGLLEQW